jgi:iron complex outermembrane recepter protein
MDLEPSAGWWASAGWWRGGSPHGALKRLRARVGTASDCRRGSSAVAGVLGVVLFCVGPVVAQARPSPDDLPFRGGEVEHGMVSGTVVDASTGVTLAGASVRIREMGGGVISGSDGTFRFARLAPRSYTVLVQRTGYAPAEERIRLQAGETVRLVVGLTATALEISGIVVTGTGRERGLSEMYQATSVIGGGELRGRLGSSVAASVAQLPGVAQRYNGPAAAQPVIRGMGGDRVLLLEDGQRTGDIAATAADHAVSIDPFTAERIEILRGPAGLLYGSNALGGVINVVREEVPAALPEAFSMTVGAQGESVNRGITVGGVALLPLGRVALRGEMNVRSAGDSRTPLGVLPSTEMSGINASVGWSWIGTWGFAGVSYRDYRLAYGVPGEFNGELIPGAHPGGVQIETGRRTGRLQVARSERAGPFSGVALDAVIGQYQHDEIEGRVEGRPVLGARFDNLFGSTHLRARYQRETQRLRSEGALGMMAHARDNRALGGFTGSRSARSYSLAGFGYEDVSLAGFRVEVGGRYDLTRVVPLSLAPIRIGGREVPVHERLFGAFSASTAVLRDVLPGWAVGVRVARAFRTPSIEELYSDGPHLGDFSFDIGNPDLEPEIGLGSEVLMRGSLPRLQLEASAFYNLMRGYIHHQPTGEIDSRFHRFPVFEATGEHARFLGAEGGAQWEPLRRLVVDGHASWVRARRLDSDAPLPSIPPFSGGARARWEGVAYFISLGVNGARPQYRVAPAFPDPLGSGNLLVPERPTPGYRLVNASAGLRWMERNRFHTLTLAVDNLTDSVWRDHLSRIKDVAPQPGRNLRLLYQVQL